MEEQAFNWQLVNRTQAILHRLNLESGPWSYWNVLVFSHCLVSVKIKAGPKAVLSWAGIVIVLWKGTEVVPRCVPQASGRGSVGVSHLFCISPNKNLACLNEKGQMDLQQSRVALTLMHWLGPPLFSLWCFDATLAIWGERLAKGPYQENNVASSETRTYNP